ncbi:hypothetical protein GCM10010287_44880 [Streptomyces variabilis]|uniref:Secreted protein n=1 Tax=Streptomyces variabilis TaxID=67372 RepID=A0ABQ2U5C2_9ACTN|nr:hypothetical protein GCM10010265_51170 [Streptomyces griseoincarnatus]GGT65367.1 hypothetical protein GCM10010287_44880 [Streptomyces variabilis]
MYMTVRTRLPLLMLVSPSVRRSDGHLMPRNSRSMTTRWDSQQVRAVLFAGPGPVRAASFARARRRTGRRGARATVAHVAPGPFLTGPFLDRTRDGGGILQRVTGGAPRLVARAEDIGGEG